MNQVIFHEPSIRLHGSSEPADVIRIVSSDTIKFSTESLFYEIFTGTDGLGANQWRKADSHEQNIILNHLGKLYIKQLQKKVFGE